MGKNVKLNNKKHTKKQEKESFFFFVKDQGEGAARIAVIVIKVLEMIMTTIFGLCLGIFAPLCIWFGLDTPEISSDPAAAFWFASSILYIIGLFVLMLGHSKTASVIHVLAAAGTLMTYYRYMLMFANSNGDKGLSGLYMPCLFITVMTIAAMLLINLPKWLDKRVQKQSEIAPSILGDDDERK